MARTVTSSRSTAPRRLSIRNQSYSGFFTGGRVSLGATLNPNTTTFTLAFWFTTSYRVGSQDLNIYAQQDGTGTGRSWAYIQLNSGKMGSRLSGAEQVTTFVPRPGVWYFYTLTYNPSTQTLTQYMDGVQIGQSTSLVPESATGNHQVGQSKFFGTPHHGRLHSVRLFSRDFSAAEVADLYYDEKFSRTDLVEETLFNEGTGTPADSGPNAYSHSTAGSFSWSTNTRFKARNVISQARLVVT